MADLLAAASLLLTVLTILYSLWYVEVQKASHCPIDRSAANREKHYADCRAVFLWKTLPLCVATVILFVANVPPVLNITARGVAKTVAGYDPVATVFVAVTTVLLFLAGHTIYAAIVLGRRVWRLSPSRGDYPPGMV
jgi:hypothetical protein